MNAGFKEVYLITSPKNEAFKEYVGSAAKNNPFAGALDIMLFSIFLKEEISP